MAAVISEKPVQQSDWTGQDAGIPLGCNAFASTRPVVSLRSTTG